MPDQSSLLPIIPIYSNEARDIDVASTLRRIYYQPTGYHRTAKKLFETIKNMGYDFTINEVQDWLERQAIHQVHKPRPKYIPRVSFSTITTPNEVHQADVLYTRHVKSGRTIYLFYLNVVDVASRYKATIPIGVTLRGSAKKIKDMQGILTSSTIAKCLKKIYDNPDSPLIWPKVFLTDRGSEFKGECEKILRKHGVKIQKARTKNTMGIVERYNRTFYEKFSRILDGKDLLRPLNSIQAQLGITPAEAIKRKSVTSKPSYPRDGPMGYDEEKLSYYDNVRYLLTPSDMKGGRRWAGDINWSQELYHIHRALVQKNQPVLYWLIDDEGNSPERSFVREELLFISEADLPP